jgi:hypothetical protein
VFTQSSLSNIILEQIEHINFCIVGLILGVDKKSSCSYFHIISNKSLKASSPGDAQKM